MLDWDDLRYFLAVARGGTLSAAARSLHVAQPTVGRRIEAFESSLGTQLFRRRPTGLELTAAGAKLVAHAEHMEGQAIAAERALAGRDTGVAGTVRVTASEWLVIRVLAPIVGRLLARHTAIAVELVADTRHLNLVRNEADVALRPSEFAHDSVKQRAVVQMAFALYASPTYLAHRGEPDFARSAEGHAVIAMSADIGDVARTYLATTCANARVALHTNGREAMATLVEAGVGIACLPRIVGDALPNARRLRAPDGPTRTLWLGVHEDVHRMPRIRAVTRFLASELARLRGAFAPS